MIRLLRPVNALRDETEVVLLGRRLHDQDPGRPGRFLRRWQGVQPRRQALAPGHAGQRTAFIRQKLLAWGPTYEITRNGALAAVVKKHLFTLFRCKFTVDVPGPDDLEAEG